MQFSRLEKPAGKTVRNSKYETLIACLQGNLIYPSPDPGKMDYVTSEIPESIGIAARQFPDKQFKTSNIPASGIIFRVGFPVFLMVKVKSFGLI